MLVELPSALALFAFVSSITPGPNNLMLMASGANFGFIRTLPHILGVGLGFMVMVATVGTGLMQLVDSYPASYTVLKVFSVAYLLYLAVKIATAAAPENAAAPEKKKADSGGSREGKPMTFIEAALFQWANPKAWSMALTAITVYAPSRNLDAVLLVSIVFGVINLPSVGLWAVLGQQLGRLLTSTGRLRWFNGSMATLLVLSLYPLLQA